jgi:hypothetical protein
VLTTLLITSTLSTFSRSSSLPHLFSLRLSLSQLTAPATITCRLNIENWSSTSNVGLNLSIFDALSSLEPAGDPSPEPQPQQQQSQEDPESQPQPRPESQSSVGRKLLASCSPSSALCSSNNGVYVIRPSGPALQAVELGIGQFLLVPSTFQPTVCRFILDLHILSSASATGTGSGGAVAGEGTGYRLTQLR